MKKSRTHYAVLNTSVSTFIYIVNTILKFVMRSAFIFFLGETYLGVNSLFTSIIGMLSLSELGIGGAIVYSLYKPLAEDDHVKVKSLMVLYKKIYMIIGLVVAVIGLLLLPFIPNMVGKAQIPHINIIYLLFLFNSVSSYFFSYNSSLLNADQKNYVIIINNFIFMLTTNIVQLIVLWLTHNFIVYLCVAIFFTLMGNIVLKLKVDKEYSYLKDVPISPLDKETITRLKKNSFGNLADKIGSSVVISTDNIYISIFAGVNIVGFYNNYMTIIGAVNALMSQINGAVIGGLGNLVATSTGEKSYQVFKKHNFINFFLIFMFSIGCTLLMNDFIGCWVGSRCELPGVTVTLIILNYILSSYRNTALTFISVYGLSWYTRWKVFWECILNVVFSAIFLIGFNMGLNGVILGTICSNIFVVEWWEPYALFKYGFKLSIRPYVKIAFKQLTALLTAILLVNLIASHIVVTGWIMLFVKGFVVVLLSFIIFVIIFGRSEEFKYTVDMITKILKRR